jgi:hypothetical protein
MTTLLSLPARPDAPVACDMSAAEDTVPDRMAEYRRLFDQALIERTSTEATATFTLATHPGVREWVLDLVRREAACCPFLSYDVTTDADRIIWTISGADLDVLDEILASASSD